MKLDTSDNRGKNNKIFTDENEKSLYDYVVAVFINCDLYFDDTCLQITAKKLWNTLNPTNKDYFKASKGWIYYYKKRWNLSTRRASYCRISIKNNILQSNIFIEKCAEIKNKINKQFIFNVDETFWRLINGSIQVIGKIGTENRKVITHIDNKSGFTSIFIISAAGSFLKPIIVMKGKTNRCLIKTCLDDDSLAYQKFSTNGWVSKDIMLFILKNIHNISKGNPSALIMDAYSIHKLDCVKNTAAKLNIQLLYVPVGTHCGLALFDLHFQCKSNRDTTSIHQPLDVGINGPIKSISKRVNKEMLLMDPYKIQTIKDSIKVLIESKTLIKTEIVINSFNKACGI